MSSVVKSGTGKNIKHIKVTLLIDSMRWVLIIQKHPEKSTSLLKDLISHGNRFVVAFNDKPFTAEAVFINQNDHVLTLGSGISEASHVSTTIYKYPASLPLYDTGRIASM